MRIKARAWDEKYAAHIRKSFGRPPGEFNEEPGVFLDGVRLGCVDEEKMHRLVCNASLEHDLQKCVLPSCTFYGLKTSAALKAALTAGAIPVTPAQWNQIQEEGIDEPLPDRERCDDPSTRKRKAIDMAWDHVRAQAKPAEGWNKQVRAIAEKMKQRDRMRRRGNFWNGIYFMAGVLITATIIWYSTK